MSSEIIYLRGQSEEHRDLLHAFAATGHTPRVVRSFKEVMHSLETGPPRAVVIDASTSDNEVADRMTEISAAPSLFKVPVIFFGRHAVERTKELAPRYRNFIAIDYPFRLGSFLARFNAADESSQVETARRTVKLSDLNPAQLDGSFGGLTFANGGSRGDFDDNVLLPEHPQREKLKRALDDITARNSWLGIHARRTGFVTAAAATDLVLPAYAAGARTASLLLNWSLADAEEERVRCDFLQSRDDERAAVGEAFKLSADLVLQRTGDQRAAEIISAVASLVQNDAFKADPQTMRAAETVFLFESADRACWKNGGWENSGAHRMLRSLRQNRPQVESDIRAAVARVLGEAVATAERGRTVFVKALSEHERLVQKGEVTTAFESARGMFSSGETRQVRFFELKEGMRLAAPLVAADGQLVLPANTVLDFDILLRLFQLSAVRRISGAVLIVER